jgi:translation initiation factor 1
MARRKKIAVDGTAETVENTVLGDLLRDSGLVPNSDPVKQADKKDPAGKDTAVSMKDLSGLGKMVLRVQRKGMGGKTVTVLTCQNLVPDQLEPLAKELRKGLGCGSRVEEAGIILQGDVAERAARWLRGRGAKRIVGGS